MDVQNLDESRNEGKEHYVKPGVKNQMQKLQKNVEAAETKVKYTHSGEIENFGRQLGMLEHQAKAGAGGPKPEELQKVVDAIELIEELLEQQLFNESTYDQDSFNKKGLQHQACADHKD